MNTITWLHLSDLHFRAGEQHTWDENIVLEALLADVRARIREDGFRPDLILVSGDIAFSGNPQEYALAGAFFEELLSATNLPRDRIFPVPGNHDLDRKAISRGAQAIANSLTDRESTNAILNTPADRQLLFDRFQAYAGWINEYLGGHLSFDDERTYYVHTLDLAGQRLALLGLNSAWVAASDEDRARSLPPHHSPAPAGTRPPSHRRPPNPTSTSCWPVSRSTPAIRPTPSSANCWPSRSGHRSFSDSARIVPNCSRSCASLPRPRAWRVGSTGCWTFAGPDSCGTFYCARSPASAPNRYDATPSNSADNRAGVKG